MRVVISIVSWNSVRHLPKALASVAGQTWRDLSVIVVDNGSDDGSADLVRSEYPAAVLIRNVRNLGFARAHNQAVAFAAAHLRRPGEETFILIMNPDVVLEEDCVEKLAEGLERRREAGSAAPKLLKLFLPADDLVDPIRSDVIDAAGIRISRSRRAVNRGEGERDGPRFARTEEVFGPSGALAMYRLSALEEVGVGGEVFDDDFFLYKEDVDLAWRLRLAGWGSVYVAGARAWHVRTAGGRERPSLLDVIRGRARRSERVRALSYRNHLLMLVKNERLSDLIRDLPRIGLYEAGKLAYAALFDRSTLAALPSLFRLLPKMARKRRRIMASSKVSGKEMRKWLK